jgi:Protein of unknown function (DUF429)
VSEGPLAVAVDWSGRRTGERRHIWWAEAQGGRLFALRGSLSREEVVEHLLARADSHPHLVVGLDFAFSLPAWYVSGVLGARDAPAAWAAIAERGESLLAECPPPFWGRPGRPRPAGTPQWRRTELALRPRPRSVFQIGGAGAVGTGSLRGMPHLERLHAGGFSIWPFDPPGGPRAIEIWPRLCTGPVRKSRAAERARVLALTAGISPGLRDLAQSSEDAFDAALTALAMSRAARAIAELPQAPPGSAELLEGQIWDPDMVRP